MKPIKNLGIGEFTGVAAQMQRASIQRSLMSTTETMNSVVGDISSIDQTNWALPAPSNVVEAINRLAAAVKALSGVDIP